MGLSKITIAKMNLKLNLIVFILFYISVCGLIVIEKVLEVEIDSSYYYTLIFISFAALGNFIVAKGGFKNIK